MRLCGAEGYEGAVSTRTATHGVWQCQSFQLNNITTPLSVLLFLDSLTLRPSEAGSDMLLRNVGGLLPNYTALQII